MTTAQFAISQEKAMTTYNTTDMGVSLTRNEIESLIPDFQQDITFKVYDISSNRMFLVSYNFDADEYFFTSMLKAG